MNLERNRIGKGRTRNFVPKRNAKNTSPITIVLQFHCAWNSYIDQWELYSIISTDLEVSTDLDKVNRGPTTQYVQVLLSTSLLKFSFHAIFLDTPVIVNPQVPCNNWSNHRLDLRLDLRLDHRLDLKKSKSSGPFEIVDLLPRAK